MENVIFDGRKIFQRRFQNRIFPNRVQKIAQNFRGNPTPLVQHKIWLCARGNPPPFVQQLVWGDIKLLGDVDLEFNFDHERLERRQTNHLIRISTLHSIIIVGGWLA